MKKIIQIILISLLIGTQVSTVMANQLFSQQSLHYKINDYKTCQELGCFPNTPVSFQNYMRSVYQRIESIAQIPVNDAYGKIGASFYVNKYGQVSNIRITRSSGNQSSDQAAINAIQKAAPFGPFPPEYTAEGMLFNFIFYLQSQTETYNQTSNMFSAGYQPQNNSFSANSTNPFLPSPLTPSNQREAKPLTSNKFTSPGLQSNRSSNTGLFTQQKAPQANQTFSSSNPFIPIMTNNNSNAIYKPQSLSQNNNITSNKNPIYQATKSSDTDVLNPNDTRLTSSASINIYAPNTQDFSHFHSMLTEGAGINLNKNPKNPMNYQYQPRYGHYFNTIQNYINSEGILAKDYHYQKFPIKYWIQSMPPQIEKIFRDSINEYAYYFPMVETRNKQDADIVLELKQVVGSDYRTLGKAGLEYLSLKGNVYLSPKVFDKNYIVLAKLTVKHELGHALGVIKHSDNINDLMYAMQRIEPTSDPYKAKVRETGQVKTFEDFAKFSYRDLNTLWILYNQWW